MVMSSVLHIHLFQCKVVSLCMPYIRFVVHVRTDETLVVLYCRPESPLFAQETKRLFLCASCTNLRVLLLKATDL